LLIDSAYLEYKIGKLRDKKGQRSKGKTKQKIKIGELKLNKDRNKIGSQK
jgi:hypothetical protein